MTAVPPQADTLPPSNMMTLKSHEPDEEDYEEKSRQAGVSEQLSEKRADEPPEEDEDDETPYKQMLKNGPPLELHFDDEKPAGFDDDDKKSQNTMLDRIKDILPSQLFGAAAP